jgi:hypothetical protein
MTGVALAAVMQTFASIPIKSSAQMFTHKRLTTLQTVDRVMNSSLEKQIDIGARWAQEV